MTGADRPTGMPSEVATAHRLERMYSTPGVKDLLQEVRQTINLFLSAKS
jgi:hypothetical protein